MKNKYYDVYNSNGVYLTSFGGDEWCWAAKGSLPINEACGGCTGCMIMQAQHYGYDVIENEGEIHWKITE